MRAQFLYFPFDAAAIARIDPATPIDIAAGPADHPDWMRLRFKVTDPTTPLPLRPIFAGQLFFQPDPPVAPRTLPPIDFAFQWTAAEYAGWQTKGRVGVTLDPRMQQQMARLPGMPPIVPNRIWFWPARISQGLLYGPMRDPANTNPMFTHAAVRPLLGATIAKANTPAWQAAAVSSFLSGDYTPKIKWHDTDLTRDGLAQATLPVLDPAADGSVELWIATALAAEDASLSDGVLGTLAVAGAYIAADGPLTPTSILNASLNAREVLTALRGQMIDAAAPNALADVMLPAVPPASVPVRVALLGTQDSLATEEGRYLSGSLTNGHVRVRSATGTLLQDRDIPLHGRITVVLPTAAAELPPTLELTSAQLEVTAAPTSSLTGPWTLPSAATTDPVRFSVAPTGGAASVLSLLALDLSRSVATRTITRLRLEACDTRLRPAGWPAAGIPTTDSLGRPIASTIVLAGTREPWGNLNDWELQQIIRAVKSITGVPAAMTVSVAHAFLLWAMEGKISATTAVPGIPGGPLVSQARNRLKVRSQVQLSAIGGAAYDAATAGQIASLVRAWTFFQVFGLDDFNNHAGVNDNLPNFDPATPIATLAANHDAAFDTARLRIVAAGLNPPDRATINGAFTAVKVGSGAATDWEFRCANDCIERIIALQYCEFLRRVMLLPANVTGTVNDASGNPFDVRRFPAFGYMAFNGGITVSRLNQTIDPTKRVFVEWPAANASIGASGCPGTNPEEALLCTKVTAQEIQFMVNGHTRRGSSRLNGIQFGALVDSYGRVFPVRV